MKRKAIYAFAVIGLTVLSLGGAVRSSPAWRTKAYFAWERDWKAHWPWNRGKWLPVHARWAFEPFVPVRVEVDPGMDMLLDPEDSVSRTILETGQWEPESWAAIKEHLPVGGTFVDVGAHIGTYSLEAARAVGSKGHVIAIEPNPDTVEKLRDNIRASGASAIAVQPVACSDSEAVLDLFAADRANTGETSLSRVNATQSGGVSKVYRVRVRPLDAIVQEAAVSRVDAIKIDVEGAELLVLKGARQTLARYGPILIIELIDRQLRSMGTSTAEVTAFLRSQGYTPRLVIGTNTEFAK